MKYKKFFQLDSASIRDLKKIPGPILIFGAGGFIGSNVLASLLLYRKDVYGVFQNPKKNWRCQKIKFPRKSIKVCNILQKNKLKKLLQEIKPKTVFNLAAYGAYSFQENNKKMYQTNFLTALAIIEILKRQKFNAYIEAGSSSEYGENSIAPLENVDLFPNSHYAVSKAAASLLTKYYGKQEKLPVIHVRLYSVYGPFEDINRLIPVAIQKARNNGYPNFVNSNISRDFMYTTDVTRAFIAIATKIDSKFYGEIFNIGTGKKTTIKTLAYLLKKNCKIEKKPEFGKMKNRKWDHTKDWYADTKKIIKFTKYLPKVTLEKGIDYVIAWQKEIRYDAFLRKGYEK